MKDYKKLLVWQKSIEIVKYSYILSKQLPNEEKFGIVSQMNRAAVSIPANIAEGSSRNSDKDYGRFLKISLGSAFELQTYCILFKELEWKVEGVELLETKLEEIIKMLHSFIKQLNS